MASKTSLGLLNNYWNKLFWLIIFVKMTPACISAMLILLSEMSLTQSELFSIHFINPCVLHYI